MINWTISLGVVISLVTAFALCLCGCKKKIPKNELLGLAGMVKITNPDESFSPYEPTKENQNNIPKQIITSPESSHSNKRSSTSANRSLPDIPVVSVIVDSDSADPIDETNGDQNSALYATVEEKKNLNNPALGIIARDCEASTSQEKQKNDSSQNIDFPPYAQVVKDHPYDRLKKSDHPYAKVQNESELESTRLEVGDSDNSTNNPVPPPRTRKSSSHNSLQMEGSTNTETNNHEQEIAAATAITGRMSANQNFPYITPPSQPHLQPDFPQDPQDSKGYTSISVREPLANIKAQTKLVSRTQELVDSHYTSVSDDSEEMYEAIEDQGGVYTSGSETYAQIEPLSSLPLRTPIRAIVHEIPVSTTTTTTLNPSPCSTGEFITSTQTPTSSVTGITATSPNANISDIHSPPQPPSVDSLKQVAQVHSRQASSSSAASSVAILGSPKPEKRQANSPLPPPPSISVTPSNECSSDLEPINTTTSINSVHILNESLDMNIPGISTLEDMYAKVIKKNRNSKSNDGTKVSSNPHKENRFSCEMVSSRDIFEVEALYSSEPELTLDKKQDHISNNTQIAHTPGYESIGPSRSIGPQAEDMNYEKVQKKSSLSNKDLKKNNAESINDSKGDTDPGYACIKNERRLQPDNDDSGYEKVDLSKNDPGYEQIVSRTGNPPLEPNYASISRNRFKRPISQCSGSEIGYLSISSDPSDSGYERVASRGTLERPIDIDPKYASIERNNKRDIKYIDDHLEPTEPNYESMPCRSTEGSESDPNYESVHYFPNIKQEPPYHLLENDSASQNEERGSLLNNNNILQDYIETNSEPGYEQIGSNKTSTYSDNSNIKL